MELFFPKNISCIFCNAPISKENDLSLCKSCKQKMKYIEEICIRCGRFGQGASLCTNCAQEKYHFDRAYSVLEYNDLMHSNIYKYKYGHKGFLAEYFAEIMKRFILENDLDFDYITGVPITKKRQSQRGYNQSYLIAKQIGEEKFTELFFREKETRFLSKLSKVQRMLELENAFRVNSAAVDKMVEEHYLEKVSEKEEEQKIKVILIDDILTTGATVNEMSKLLKHTIADVEITVLTLCSARK